MEGFRWLPSALNNPRLNILLANAPDDYHGGFSWYNIYDKPGIGVERSRRLLFDLLDRQRADGFATKQTFVLGFSQGCLMTHEVGIRYPHRFAGLVGISGYAHEPERHAALRLLSETPCSGESPQTLVADNWITPNALFFVRNHHPVR